jgi:tRNA dimethylallyltransferase
VQENPELIKILLDLGDEEESIKNLDRQRLVRRIEVLKQTGKNLSWWQNQPKKQFFNPKDFVHFNIELDRDLLYQNCNNRFKNMLESGAIQEVEKLIKLGAGNNSSIAKTIGFVEIKDYLEGKINKEQLIEICSQKTRNYAKRQLTWFRNQFKDPRKSPNSGNFGVIKNF